MLVTEFGISMLVNALHPENAFSPMLVTPCEILTFVTLVFLNGESFQ